EGKPADGMVRIRLRASAINYFDSLMIAGQYQTKPDLPFVPGSEVSGEVISAPTGSGFQAGDRVMALMDNQGLTRGGYAEVAGGGRDRAINSKTQDSVEEVKKITGGRGADVVYDPVGGDVYDRSTKCIAFEGRIVIVGFTSGRIPQAATNHVLVKNYSGVGLHWGLYSKRAPELIPL